VPVIFSGDSSGINPAFHYCMLCLFIEIQWMVRLNVFRVNILTPLGVILTAGRYLLPNVDLLAGLYPPSDTEYGSLMLEGDQPTPANLGITNKLVWSDG